MLWNYHQGYDTSINWEVTTTAETIEFPAWELDNGLIKHQINGENYLLTERYSGSEITRNVTLDQLYLAVIWIGLCVFLGVSTYFNRYLFFVVMAALALMINRLNLYQIGLFGIEDKWVMMLPFIALGGPLIYFHEVRKNTPLLLRIASLVVISAVLCLGIKEGQPFTDHFIAHSLFPFAIYGLVFLLLISEEVIFSLLYVVSSSKGGKSNHLHFIILSLAYLGNLILYYLNKSGIYENAFFFFDPFILLVVTCIVSVWSLKFKEQFANDYIPVGLLHYVFASLGIMTLTLLSLSMSRGMDAVYQSFHYFILYFHIGFGVLFFFYILANFLDPLIKGLQVYKIAYRERNFPYVTAKLGGLVVIAAFYFLAAQEPYNLLRSGYFNYLSIVEKGNGNKLLGKEYLIQAGFLGYNTHYPNYTLGWEAWKDGKDFRAKSNFFNAAQRFPSPYTWVNYGNIDSEFNPNKVQAAYEESLRRISSPEMKNNLGLIHMNKNEIDKALSYFENLDASVNWNNAPLINKWNALKKINAIDSIDIEKEYIKGNFGVKANILTSVESPNEYPFNYKKLNEARSLHRQAYLLNSSYLHSHDSIEQFIQVEIDNSTSSSNIERLSRALALHLYEKGEVNSAFQTLDKLQANAHPLNKGEYLAITAKFALDQGAYQLSLDYFNKAIDEDYKPARLGKIESLAALNRQEEITNLLLSVIKEDPSLTKYANELLSRIEDYSPMKKEYHDVALENLNTGEVITEAEKNAFNEELLLKAVDELNKRDTTGGYELLVEAIEINPYSIKLLKRYIISALYLNLNTYAEQSLDQLKGMITDAEYQEFYMLCQAKKEEFENDEW